jgi:hypothetical protein
MNLELKPFALVKLLLSSTSFALASFAEKTLVKQPDGCGTAAASTSVEKPAVCGAVCKFAAMPKIAAAAVLSQRGVDAVVDFESKHLKALAVGLATGSGGLIEGGFAYSKETISGLDVAKVAAVRAVVGAIHSYIDDLDAPDVGLDSYEVA